jgi:hypothetical protein
MVCFRHLNIIIDAINKFHYSFLIIICNCKTKVNNAKNVILPSMGHVVISIKTNYSHKRNADYTHTHTTYTYTNTTHNTHIHTHYTHLTHTNTTYTHTLETHYIHTTHTTHTT